MIKVTKDEVIKSVDPASILKIASLNGRDKDLFDALCGVFGNEDLALEYFSESKKIIDNYSQEFILRNGDKVLVDIGSDCAAFHVSATGNLGNNISECCVLEANEDEGKKIVLRRIFDVV